MSAARALAYSSLVVTSLLSAAVRADAGGAPGELGTRALAAASERAGDGSVGAPGGRQGDEALDGQDGDWESGGATVGTLARWTGDGALAGPQPAATQAERPAEPAVQCTAPAAPSVIPARAVVAAIPASPPAPGPGAPEVSTSGVARTRVDLPLQVEVHGQVFFGVSADARQGWERDVALDRARIEVRGRVRELLTVIEADVSSTKKPLKDAFARLDGPAATRLTAGQFKAPFLERETESAWSLPLVDRGLVDDYVVDRNGLGGRRLGVVGALRPFHGALEVSTGIFQGTDLGYERRREDYVARVAARPWRWLEAGTSGYRAGSTEGPVRQAAAGFLVLKLGPLAATLEALGGRLSQGPFTAGLGLLELGLRLPWRLRLTPIAGLEALRLRGPAAGTGSSAVVGAVLGAGGGLKLKVQAERARRPGDTAPANAVAVQLATRF